MYTWDTTVYNFLRSHVQDGKTALYLACKNKHKAAAEALMEATKLAGALDHQVADNDDASLERVWCEECGQVVGGGGGR